MTIRRNWLHALPIALALLAACLSGCGTTNGTEKTESDDPQVSTIPWNKPAKWEGKSGLGGGVGY